MEHPPWEPVRKQRAFEQVLEQIEQRIRDGHLATGDRLPPERELGEVLGVGRPAVREALRVLESLGIVDARTGRGDEAGSRIIERPAAALTRLLRFHIGLAGFSMTEVLETRIMLETWAADAAAARRTPEDIAALRETLDAMAEPGLSADRFMELDTDFHVRMTAAGGNRLVARWMEALRGAIAREMAATYAELDRDPDTLVERLRGEHEEMLERIVRRDSTGAAELARPHIERFYDRHL